MSDSPTTTTTSSSGGRPMIPAVGIFLIILVATGFAKLGVTRYTCITKYGKNYCSACGGDGEVRDRCTACTWAVSSDEMSEIQR